MPYRDLRRLAGRFTTAAVQLEAQFSGSRVASVRGFAVISLYAEWEEFSRRLLYSSAYAQPHAGYGAARRVTRAPGIRTHADVEMSLRKYKRTRPQYRLIVHLGSPTQMAGACQHLQLNNSTLITAAITSQNSPADPLRLIRNYLSHQNSDTAQQVDLGRRRPKVDIDECLAWLGETMPGGRPRFGVWASDLADVARACAG